MSPVDGTKGSKRKASLPPDSAVSKKAKVADLKALAASIGECLPCPRKVTVLQFCDLADKFADHPHQLPGLALYHTFSVATFQEVSLVTILGELDSSWQRMAQCPDTPDFPKDMALKNLDSKKPEVAGATVKRLAYALDLLVEKHRTVCANDPKREANGGKCLPLSDLGAMGVDLVKVLERKRPTNKAILQAALPLVEAFRIHPGIDGRSYAYTAADRAAADKSEAALRTLGEKFPFLNSYTDPPHVMAITSIAALLLI